ncbi:MAG: HAMP domain-containing sensor histidine kinase [Terrisporobacter sp.]
MINKNVFNDTKKKLIKINVLVVCGFLILFSLFTYFYFKSLSYESIDTKLEEEYEYISMQINRSSYINPIALKDPRDLVYIYKNDRLIFYTKSDYFINGFPSESILRENNFFTYEENNYTFRELCLTINDVKVRIIRNIDSELSSLKQLFFVIGIAIIFSIISTYFIALYLTKKALVPIETAWSNQVKFIQDASHELRTPITIASSKLQSLLTVPNNTISDEVETIADVMTETRRLKKIIQDLLSLTKEDAVIKMNTESFDLEELLKDLCKDYYEICEIQNKFLEFNSTLKEKMIKSDKTKLRQLVLIFLDNAFKYTRPEDKILMSIKERDNKFICIIEDSGIGINKEDLPHIFERFFRSDNIRNKDIDGSGIGLSIAKMISINLKCSINVKSEINKGTTFEIIIPKQIS